MRDGPVPQTFSWPFAGVCPVASSLSCTGVVKEIRHQKMWYNLEDDMTML